MFQRMTRRRRLCPRKFQASKGPGVGLTAPGPALSWAPEGPSRNAKSLLRGRRFRSRRLPPPWPGNLNYRARLQSETCAVPAASGASLRVPVPLQRTHSQRRPAARVDPSASGQDGNGERVELANGMPPMAHTLSTQ